MPDTLVETILDGDMVALRDGIEQVIAKRVYDKIQDKKVEILAKINGVTTDHMKEVMTKK